MTGEPTIDYDALALDAMRGLVRTVLARTAKSGLPGDHHFYISFDTEQPGVSLSRRLKERYPREMTIVLQHRFWDLAVHEDRFEVKLTFDGIPERLVVPFSAIKVFFDPSVQYGLRFEDAEAADSTDTAPAGATASPSSRSVASRTGGTGSSGRKSRTGPKKPKGEGLVAVSSSGQATAAPARPVPLPRAAPTLAPVASAAPVNGAAAGSAAAQGSHGQGAPAQDAPASGAASDGAQGPRNESAAPPSTGDGEPKPANTGAQILSLDQFRKK